MKSFVRSFDYARLRRLRYTVMKRFEFMEKFYSSKTLLKMASGGDAYAAYPTSLLDLSLVV